MVLLFWLIGLLVLYTVIYLAVKHALNNAQSLRELRDEIRALRMSSPPHGPTSGPPYGPSDTDRGNWT
ncbi:hypothetical protein [Thermobacillus sp.]|uniref:hypothetical protein n=1 Tax=Thermobacillus sp. TaxID=2108467 RepID=UPI00257DAC8E|nr:hypothetical protein [Thermobacillus sp.]